MVDGAAAQLPGCWLARLLRPRALTRASRSPACPGAGFRRLLLPSLPCAPWGQERPRQLSAPAPFPCVSTWALWVTREHSDGRGAVLENRPVSAPSLMVSWRASQTATQRPLEVCPSLHGPDFAGEPPPPVQAAAQLQPCPPGRLLLRSEPLPHSWASHRGTSGGWALLRLTGVCSRELPVTLTSGRPSGFFP